LFHNITVYLAGSSTGLTRPLPADINPPKPLSRTRIPQAIPIVQEKQENVEVCMQKRLVVLTDGYSEPITAKTAVSVIRYGHDKVIALLDTTQPGKTSQELLGIGGNIPVVANLKDAGEADVLLIGIAPPGGRMPPQWRPILLEAIRLGMDIVSGLHDFISEDPEMVSAAKEFGVVINDVRKNDEHEVANRVGIRLDCLRIQAIGQDCCVGKKVVAIEIARALQQRGSDAKFVATGQTGIMIEGDGCPVDTVVADFLNGAVEKLVLQNQHHDILVFEGQGSLAHPRYSAVTLGLLHGAMPHGMILCYEAGREGIHNMEQIPLTSLAQLRTAYETMANLMHPSKVIGVAMNSRLLGDDESQQERERVGKEFGLPVCDVLRHGPNDLVEAVLKMQQEFAG
jgi:uncharacterized NAD-dependent epimerase/dehydratase family protein